jgi:hypothetical protein
MRFVMLLALLFCCTVIAYCQPGDPNGGNPPGVPITGLEILLAGGAALGIRKLIQDRKPKV